MDMGSDTETDFELFSDGLDAPLASVWWADDDDAAGGFPIEIVDELVFDDVVDEPCGPTFAAADAFLELAEVMDLAALAAGAATGATGLLRALLGIDRFDALTPSPEALTALLESSLVLDSHGRIARSEQLVRQVAAWQGILRGESEDYGACGSLALDEWAADLVARAVGNPQRAPAIRRELRSRGVAAFGIVRAA